MDDAMKELGDRAIVPVKRDLSLPNASSALLAENPAAVLAAGYNAQENFLTAVQDAAVMHETSGRAEAYMTVADCLMLAGKNSDNEFRLAQSNLNDYQQEFHSKNKVESTLFMQHGGAMITGLYFDLAGLAARRNDNSLGEVVSGLHDHILGYRFDNDDIDMNARSGNKELQYEWVRRQVAQVEDLGRLVEFLSQYPDRANQTPEQLVQEIKEIVTEDLFQKRADSEKKALGLSALARVQILTGDVVGAESTVDELKKYKTPPNPKITYDEHAEVRKHKIKGVALMAAAQSRVAESVSPEDFTPEQIDQVLASGNPAAVTALGFRGIDLDKIWEREDIGQEVKDQLLAGVEKRLEAEEQRLNNQRQLIASKRKSLGTP